MLQGIGPRPGACEKREPATDAYGSKVGINGRSAGCCGGCRTHLAVARLQVVRLPIFALLVIFECVFRLMPATDSAASRPPIPRHAGHPHWEIRHSRVRPG